MAKQTGIVDILKNIKGQFSHHDMRETAIPSYTHWNPLVQKLFWKRLESLLLMVPKQNKRILDFGCGSGILLPFLADRATNVVGIDIDTRFVKLFLKNYPLKNVKITKSITNQPTAFFDCIICADVLEHVDNLNELIKTITSKLKPDGCLIISGPTENFFYRLGRLTAGFKGDYHHRTIYDIRSAIQKSGLSMKKKINIPSWPVLFQIYRFER